MKPRTLIAYYSMSGHTRQVAQELCTFFEADLEEIREPHRRHGFTGVLRSLLDAGLHRMPEILPPEHDPADYDLLVLGGPIWAGRLAAPLRGYARRHGVRAKHIAFFCTEGGRGSETGFADLSQLSQHDPLATLAIDAEHLPPVNHRGELGRFVALARRSNEDSTPAPDRDVPSGGSKDVH